MAQDASRDDTLCIFTGSGNSGNIIKTIATASMLGIPIIGFLGRDGGKCKKLLEVALHVEEDLMESIEDMHSILFHDLVLMLKKDKEKEMAAEHALRVYVDLALALEPGQPLQLTQAKLEDLGQALEDEVKSIASPNGAFIGVPIQVIS